MANCSFLYILEVHKLYYCMKGNHDHRLSSSQSNNVDEKPTRKLNKKVLFCWILILVLFALVLLYYNFEGSRLVDWQDIFPTVVDENPDIVI